MGTIRATRQCTGCKEVFRKTELVEYFSSTGKTKAWYCPKCLAERQSRDKFSNKVCQIFGITTPGPVIWTQRKRLIAEYGYTDDTIIDCLEYVYNVEQIKKLSESLYFVKPEMMENMRKWKNTQAATAGSLAAAISQTTMTERVVPVRENTSKRKEINLDEGLFDD